jgi:hypothetical protein
VKKKNKLVLGWGINDVYYSIETTEMRDNKKVRVKCRYYIRWYNMLMRCLSTNYHALKPTYTKCSICEEWKYFSNFIKWVDSQPNKDWVNCELDKDLLVTGNKIYSPDTCVFVSRQINIFTTGKMGLYLRGVNYLPDRSKVNPYVAKCSNPFIGKIQDLGYFPTEIEAHKAWQAKKHEHALRLAEGQDDPRVAKALRYRYAPDKDWTKR